MPGTKQTGDMGERIASQYLTSKGYTILERNWRSRHLELDIICQIDEFLVFVEVKYRKNTKFGDPVEFITEQKMRHLSDAAADYMEQSAYSGLIRFDIIGIRPGQADHYKIQHLEDIHFPGWDP